jgi:serine/threonine protein kinase
MVGVRLAVQSHLRGQESERACVDSIPITRTGARDAIMTLSLCPVCERRHTGDCPDTARDRRIGQVVDGKYHILRRLACGGMGSVYEARHAVVGRHFALKFLHEQYAHRTIMVQRFLREAQAAGSIASEHIIGVIDYGTVDGTPYLVMELVQGQDLRELLTDTPRLAVDRAVRIILDACRGLELAHARGLVHRDLKPANICITRRSDGREVAKVIDFGVAKLRDGADLSEEGTLIGTLGYMAPEQLTDQKELDARADIYALGVILYQALAGRPPHVCDRSELLYRIVSVDPRPLREVCPELPAGLSEVVDRALMRNKERRYPNVRDFADALQAYAGEPAHPTVPPPAARPSSVRAPRALGLGTAETELGSAPTWVALSTPSEHVRAQRQCDRPSVGGAGMSSVEEFCRQPEGGAPGPRLQSRQHSLSQRALLLSVGALALSVVAMTTMFIFVYSHGSRALEAAAVTHAPVAEPASALNRAAFRPREAPAPTLTVPPEAARSASVCAPLQTALQRGTGARAQAAFATRQQSAQPADPGGSALTPPAELRCD